jgi:AraC-like DNA-binding protein
MELPMNNTSSTLVRCVGTGVEIHAGIFPPGQAPQVVERQDLLILLERPVARLRCCGRTQSVPPGVFAVVPDGEVVALEMSEPTPYRLVYLRTGWIRETLGLDARRFDGESSSRRIAWVIAASGLCRAVNLIESETGIARLIESISRDHRTVVRFVAEEKVAHPVVRRIREHLRSSYSERLTLEELGKMAGMGRYALARAFTREVGMPPHAYQMHLRIAHARALIGTGRRLSEVSLEVGFTDQSHLNRHFKKLLGTTPGRYARAALAPKAYRGISRTGFSRKSKPVEVPVANAEESPSAIVPGAR